MHLADGWRRKPPRDEHPSTHARARMLLRLLRLSSTYAGDTYLRTAAARARCLKVESQVLQG